MSIDVEKKTNIQEVYPRTLDHIDPAVRDDMITSWPAGTGPEAFFDLLAARMGNTSFVSELARLEWAVQCVKKSDVSLLPETDGIGLNPYLIVLDLSWKHLPLLLEGAGTTERGNEYALVYKNPRTNQVVVESATSADLLALKLVADNMPPREAAATENVSLSLLETVLHDAIKKGFLVQGPSRIRRDPADFDIDPGAHGAFLSASVFTLQWHVTQVCDLHCKHCYDRTDRHALGLSTALGILAEFYEFCKSRNVRGHISFSGGNPLLYPKFTELYQAAAELGFFLAILGNPTSKERMKELNAIEPPSFYQVSLEGLADHNDKVRGAGHFDSVTAFLHILRDLEIYSMVMLTLTRDNFRQVLPLAEFLKGKTDLFTFNRLSMVGEGANLCLPSKAEYASFLEDYLDASRDNPVLSLKDNLINILLEKRGDQLFGGCAGSGCGAAFNFLTVLPDGEAHACRKFPSPVGNVLSDRIAGVYDSQKARQYRSGPRTCRDCSIRSVCGGFLAVAHSFGFDIFEQCDPFCFKER